MLSKSYKPYILLAHSKDWEIRKNIPNDKIRINSVAFHFRELFLAKNVFVYSSPIAYTKISELKEKFKISNNQKVILLLLTSGDERFAASLINVMPELKSSLLFVDQVDLIQNLISYLQKREDIKVIIRPHPREFPNKRESVYSMQGKLLKNVLTNLPSNFVVNWPTDNVSLYDLIKVVDLCLPTTSSSGLELATLGMPIITYSPDNIYAYPATDITYCAFTKREYFEKIEFALKTGWNIEFSIKAFRWWALRFIDFDIDLKDVLNYSEIPTNNLLIRVINKIKRLLKVDSPKIYKLSLPKNHLHIVDVFESNKEYHIMEYKGECNSHEQEEILVKNQLLEFHNILGIQKLKF
jgi:hypothetical protein